MDLEVRRDTGKASSGRHRTAGRLCVHSLSAQESEAHSHELAEFDWGTIVDEQQDMVAALPDIPRRT